MAKPNIVAAGDGWDITTHVSAKDADDVPTSSELLKRGMHELTMAQRDEEAIEGSVGKIKAHNDSIAAIEAVVAKGTITVPDKI